MAGDAVVFPVHAINSYLWKRITDEGILTTIPYNGIHIRPIVPVEEVPTLMQAIDAMPGIKSYPFFVYNWTRINIGDMWFIKSHEIAYSLRSDDDSATAQLIDLIDKEFQDYDIAARRLNEYISSLGSTVYSNFDFKYISLSTIGGPMPTEDENGPKESIITLRVSFTDDVARPEHYVVTP